MVIEVGSFPSKLFDSGSHIRVSFGSARWKIEIIKIFFREGERKTKKTSRIQHEKQNEAKEKNF